MTVPEMGKLLGLKRQIDTGWCIKCFESKEIAGKIRINIASFENGMPIRLNIIKLPEKNRGKN